MILGVYWYFGFPVGLYHFDYFTYRKGLGGHADVPAELTVDVTANDADKLVERFSLLSKQYRDAFLFIYKEDNRLTIGTGSYTLFDYDFLIAKEAEKLLAEENVTKVSAHKFIHPELIKFRDKQEEKIYPSRQYVQIVGSSLRKSNAETLALRLDCHIRADDKEAFLNELNHVTATVGIDVLYYLESSLKDFINLMLFLTNGRQGLELSEKKKTNIGLLEKEISRLFQQYEIQKGHAGGWDNYPGGKPVVIKMTDKDFILDQ